jgi:hypothetical protein
MSENRIFRARKANASTRHRLLLDQQEKEQRRAQARTETGAQHSCSGSEDLRRKKTDRWGAQLTSVKYWPRPVRGLGDRRRKNEGVTGNRPTQQIDAQSITNGKMNSTDEWSSGLRKRRAEFTSWDSGTGNWVRVGSIPATGSKARKEKLRLKKNRAPKSMKNEAGNGGTSRPCADETETRHGENLSDENQGLGRRSTLEQENHLRNQNLRPGNKNRAETKSTSDRWKTETRAGEAKNKSLRSSDIQKLTAQLRSKRTIFLLNLTRLQLIPHFWLEWKLGYWHTSTLDTLKIKF